MKEKTKKCSEKRERREEEEGEEEMRGRGAKRGGQLRWYFNANNNKRKQELNKHMHTNYNVLLVSTVSALH